MCENASQTVPGCSQFINARELYQPNFPNKVHLKLANKPLDIVVPEFALLFGNGPALQAFSSLPDISLMPQGDTPGDLFQASGI